MTKFLLWIKLYGGYVLSFVVAIVAAILFIQDHQKISGLVSRLEEQNNRNKLELQKLQQTQEAERARNEAIEKTYRDTLARIEATRNNDLQRLAVTQQEELKQIASNFHDDPTEMAKKVNELFGFPVYAK